MPARRGVSAVLSLVLVVSASVAVLSPGVAAAAAWPPSTGLLLAEVVTGGSSASDEYVEITNAGPLEADLGGCELIYVTTSGATTTRKALFGAPLPLAPGQHLLVANAAGIYGPIADTTYSGGLAAEGGAVALRTSGGSVVDAVGWGTATNQYVEGSVAAAPPARSSLERRPGGLEGNTIDTNDNGSDWFVQPNPLPQSLASTPTSWATASPTTSAVASMTAAGSPSNAPTVGPTEPESTMSGATATPEPPPTATPTTADMTPLPHRISDLGRRGVACTDRVAVAHSRGVAIAHSRGVAIAHRA